MEKREWVTSQEVDLMNCDREAIHIPGSIQPHGVLLVLQRPQFKILQASKNTETFFGILAKDLINQDLSILFSPSQIKKLRYCIEQNNVEIFNPIKLSIKTSHKASHFYGIIHQNNVSLILELEPVLSPQKRSRFSFYHLVKASISTIKRASSFREATELIVKEVREVTGYNRVMIYRFEPDETGVIIAEDKQAELEPYLDLHYPASDIPKQARKLYYENWLRLIVDMNYQPVAIIPANNPLTNAPLDLSFSVLRSVSPLHVEYSRNMGISASMCISLVNEKRLWGMIVCHHYSPRCVDYETRKYCEFLGQRMSVELMNWQEKEAKNYRQQINLIQQKLRQKICNNIDRIALILEQNCQTLLELVKATGAAICLGNDITLLGSTPSKEAVRDLLAWLSNSCRQEVFFTNSLSEVYPKAEEFKESASGLLAISIFLDRRSYHLVWFRPEVVQTVNWGGDPNKPVFVENDGSVRLSPRRSFELWKETVREKSLLWQQVEIDAAQELRNTLMLAALEFSQAALQEAAERAQVANHAKTQFLAKMSHELRTPLNAILGFTQVMSRDRALSPEHLENLEIINRSGEHLLSLINDVLEMSKIEAGRLTLNESSFDLYRVLDLIEELLQLKAQVKGLQLVFNRTPEVPQYAIADEGKLRQVLLNLLGNAIKFTQAGSVTLRVQVLHGSDAPNVANASLSLKVHSKEQLMNLQQSEINNQPPTMNHEPSTMNLLFEVSDTGSGIAASELDTIFEAFVQTEASRQSMQGTGLGLPISQQFVRLLGGEIAVTSTVGEGSTFTFTIPIRCTNKTDVQTASTNRRVIGLEPNQPDYRILVVEDVEENRRLMIKLLGAVGFEVRAVENGKKAIAAWKDWQPHLIWMDMLMPVMDGYEATKHIKVTVKGQATVIIALTAHSFNEEREAILNAGCDDFLLKPFQEEVLLEKMAHHLGVRYLYEEKADSREQERQKTQKISTEAEFKHDLAQMPAKWVAQLYETASLCSDDMILDLLAQIPEEKFSLVRTLTDLAKNFQFDQIKKLTQE
jgi:light-regulated signal transduction histidine kinase (bacteriophytochrome)/DNA-binding NarL/FixJ family response regulator